MNSINNQLLKGILLLLILVFVVVSYYFLYSLPLHNAKLLEFEQQKYADEKIVVEQAPLENEEKLEDCLEKAQSEYNDEFQTIFAIAEGSCPGISDQDVNCYAEMTFVTDESQKAKDHHEWAQDKCYEQY